MKQLFYSKCLAIVLLPLVFCCTLISCHDNSDDVIENPKDVVSYDAIDRINVNDTIISVYGGHIYLRVNNDSRGAGMAGLTAESTDNTWCKVKVNEYSISVIVLPNTEKESREATITIRKEGKEKSFKVVQQKHAGVLAKDDIVKVNYDAGTIVVPLTFTKGYTLSQPTESWIHQESETVVESGALVNITYQLEDNTTLEERKAEFYLIEEDSKKKNYFYIVQSADSALTIIDKKAIYEIDNNLDIRLDSRSSVNYSCSSDWLDISIEGNGKERIAHIHAHPFVSKMREREAIVEFNNTLKKTETITIKQERDFFLKLETYEVCVGETKNVDYYSEQDNPSIQWSTSDPNVFTVDEQGNIKAIGRGSATITATTSDGLSDESMVIVKDAEDFVTISMGSGSIIKVGDIIISYNGTIVVHNGLNKSINITSLKIKNNQGQVISQDNNSVNLQSQEDIQYSIRLNNIEKPLFVIEFKYKGKSYTKEDNTVFNRKNE